MANSIKTFPFGPYNCPSKELFFSSKHTFGLVNLKPIVPGHVLLIPKRVCKRLRDLSDEEVTDLYLSARDVGNVIEREYGASALTISMQDGEEAGQTVPHVHVHILPRRKGDFGRNDDIYDELHRAEINLKHHVKQMSDTGANDQVSGLVPKGVDAEEDRPPRTMDDMEKEAKNLRKLFEHFNTYE